VRLGVVVLLVLLAAPSLRQNGVEAEEAAGHGGVGMGAGLVRWRWRWG
jgi:hypothetical protein